MKPLRSADLKHRIVVRRAIRINNGRGGSKFESWLDLCQPWAEVIGLDGRESVLEHSLQGISHYRLRIWFRDGLLPADQVRYGSTDLNIRSIVDPWGDRRELAILADTASVEI